MVLKSITKKKTHETVKRELLNSWQENHDVEEAALNKTASQINNPQEAILVISRYDDIIKRDFFKEFYFKLRILF